MPDGETIALPSDLLQPRHHLSTRRLLTSHQLKSRLEVLVQEHSRVPGLEPDLHLLNLVDGFVKDVCALLAIKLFLELHLAIDVEVALQGLPLLPTTELPLILQQQHVLN